MTAGLARAGAISVLLILSGCTWYDDLFGDTVPPPCPSVLVLPEAQHLTQFRPGEGRDLTDILHEVTIVDLLLLACVYDVDENTGEGTLEVEVGVILEVERGPANRDRKAALAYFVSITDIARNVLNKEIFQVAVDFPGNRTRVRVEKDREEPITVTIPLRSGIGGDDFVIFVGMQLTREQMEYNEQRSGSLR